MKIGDRQEEVQIVDGREEKQFGDRGDKMMIVYCHEAMQIVDRREDLHFPWNHLHQGLEDVHHVSLRNHLSWESVFVRVDCLVPVSAVTVNVIYFDDLVVVCFSKDRTLHWKRSAIVDMNHAFGSYFGRVCPSQIAARYLSLTHRANHHGAKTSKTGWHHDLPLTRFCPSYSASYSSYLKVNFVTSSC